MCRSCGWQDVEEEVEEMLENGRYEWARDTLSGILERVQDEQCVTENMERAVENIRAAGER